MNGKRENRRNIGDISRFFLFPDAKKSPTFFQLFTCERYNKVGCTFLIIRGMSNKLVHEGNIARALNQQKSLFRGAIPVQKILYTDISTKDLNACVVIQDFIRNHNTLAAYLGFDETGVDPFGVVALHLLGLLHASSITALMPEESPSILRIVNNPELNHKIYDAVLTFQRLNAADRGPGATPPAR